jgi:hypothetical protein
MFRGKSSGKENRARRDENTGEDENLGGTKKETGKVCFMAVGGMDAPENQHDKHLRILIHTYCVCTLRPPTTLHLQF